MSARTERMSARDLADLEAKRRWLREHYDEAVRHQYDTLEGKLRLLATILDHAWVDAADSSSLRLFPLTSLAKRIERGEQVDIRALFQQACAQVRRLAQDADPDA
jgi:hypothetical protein